MHRAFNNTMTEKVAVLGSIKYELPLARRLEIGCYPVAAGVAAAVPTRAKPLANDRQPSGTMLAPGVAILYRAGFWTQVRYSVPTLGKVVPICSYYVTGSLTLRALAGLTRLAARLPTLREAPALFAHLYSLLLVMERWCWVKPGETWWS
jgi:hypothetical protein